MELEAENDNLLYFLKRQYNKYVVYRADDDTYMGSVDFDENCDNGLFCPRYNIPYIFLYELEEIVSFILKNNGRKDL